ncbi:MAG: hypothetical protein EKK37_03630 [Sphingobacteriales bacterium]|nr:MAG: hypothetical protein EKK37_03630 [Sphingobacteriales bacterium]
MRQVLTFNILLFIYAIADAQNNPLKQVVYFNEEFLPCKKDEAIYTGVSIKKEMGTDVILYHYNGKLALTGTYNDQSLLTKNGIFNWFDSTGSRIATIGYKNNTEHGLYLVWYPNKVLKDSGRFDHGIPDDLWKSWYADHQLKLRCSYNARKFNVFKKDWEQGKALEKIKHILAPNDISMITDSLVSANYGTHVFYPFYYNFSDAPAAEGSLRNVFERNITFTIVISSVSQICIRQDVINPCFAMLDGDYTFYYPNGQVMYSGNFKSGMKNGLWEIWNNNGKKKSVGMYNKNHEVGEWKYYNSKGDLSNIKRFGKDGMQTNQLVINK